MRSHQKNKNKNQIKIKTKQVATFFGGLRQMYVAPVAFISFLFYGAPWLRREQCSAKRTRPTPSTPQNLGLLEVCWLSMAE
jgi:hypothetical protein